MTDTYKVAVLLFDPVTDNATDAAGTIQKNYDILIPFAAQAKAEGAQMLVYPETPTGTLIWPETADRTLHAQYAEVYPPVGTKVCDDAYAQGYYQQYTMACLAKDNEIYIIQNIPEKMDCRVQQPVGDVDTPTAEEAEEAPETNNTRTRKLLLTKEERTCAGMTNKREYLFNTLAIYDPTGTMISKYRKTNTAEDRFDFAYMGSMKEVADLETFTTDFGVEFGVLICADAFNPHIFPEYAKAGVKNIIMPYYDGGRPPVYSIGGVHNGHSLNFGVNLITSASQTTGGVGVYEAGRPLYWTMNEGFVTGEKASEMKVVELPKVPSPPVQSTKPVTVYSVDSNQVTDSCRFLGSAGAEMQVPCSKVVVTPGKTTSFTYKLDMPVIVHGKEEKLSCSIQASLKTNGTETVNYAMMVGWFDSNLIDEQVFCNLVNCPDYPDCSKDCPMCIDSYFGQGILTEFHLQADVPDYFGNGIRQMPLPQMNGELGMPYSSDKYDWIKEDGGLHYMNLKDGAEIPALQSAGVLYIGLSPFDGYRDADGNILGDPEDIATDNTESTNDNTGSTSGCIASTNIAALWIAVLLMLVRMIRH